MCQQVASYVWCRQLRPKVLHLFGLRYKNYEMVSKASIHVLLENCEETSISAGDFVLDYMNQLAGVESKLNNIG